MPAELALTAQSFDATQFAALTLPVADGVFDELERAGLAKVADRKDRLKNGLQTDLVIPVGGCRVHLQKPFIRTFLDFNQIRSRNRRLDLGEVCATPFSV